MTPTRYVSNVAPGQDDAANVTVANARLVLYSPSRGVCLGGTHAVLWSRTNPQGHDTAPTWPAGTTVAVAISGMPHSDIFPADARMVPVTPTGPGKLRATAEDCVAAGLEAWKPVV